jgi:arylsulfatase A-like enzyme
MPALARYPGVITPGSESKAMISTLDVIPTFLSMIEKCAPADLDGIDVSEILNGNDADFDNERVLFFWRDGFKEGPLPPPYGRFDVAAVKMGRIKAWFWTKSAHYNADVEEFHDPPLLFDVMADPAESKPLDPVDYQDTIELIKDLTNRHKESLDWAVPLALDSDPKYVPCVDHLTGCRTHSKASLLDDN